jgi:hypothetical protein
MKRVLVPILALGRRGWIASCASKSTADDRDSKPSIEAPQQMLEVTLTDFANEPHSGEFVGVESSGVSFDPISFDRVEHGPSKTKTSFTLEKKPAHPKPTRIDFKGSAGEA